MARKVARMNKKNLRGPQKNKSFSEYAQRHQFRIKTQLKDRCYSTLSFMGEFQYFHKVGKFDYNNISVERKKEKL